MTTSLTPVTMHDGQTIGVYQVTAQGERKGSLILVQEIFGVTDHIKAQADGYAADGYDVWAPAIFDRESPGLDLGHGPDDMKKAVHIARELHPFVLTVKDMQVCIDALRDSGPVFMVGYCYGGSAAWAAACRCKGLAAASGYYGSLVPQFAAEQPRCPVILHFGRHDKGIPMEGVDKVIAAHPEVPVYIYEAGHGFNSDRQQAYDAESAKLARERTLALFASFEG